MLRRLLTIALVAGLTAGAASTLLHAAKLWPLIAAAERYEHAHAPGAPAHAHDHGQDADAWAPADGFERIAFSALFNVLVGFGFALLLNGALALRGIAGGGPPDVRTGVAWGLAGFACFALAPALGLPPELPGMAAAELAGRQAWWVFTALATAGGLALLVYARGNLWKAAGTALLVLPHAVGAPRPEGTGAVPAELAAEFVAASLIAAAVFWVVLGGVSGWMHRRLAA